MGERGQRRWRSSGPCGAPRSPRWRRRASAVTHRVAGRHHLADRLGGGRLGLSRLVRSVIGRVDVGARDRVVARTGRASCARSEARERAVAAGPRGTSRPLRARSRTRAGPCSPPSRTRSPRRRPRRATSASAGPSRIGDREHDGDAADEQDRSPAVPRRARGAAGSPSGAASSAGVSALTGAPAAARRRRGEGPRPRPARARAAVGRRRRGDSSENGEPRSTSSAAGVDEVEHVVVDDGLGVDVDRDRDAEGAPDAVERRQGPGEVLPVGERREPARRHRGRRGRGADAAAGRC